MTPPQVDELLNQAAAYIDAIEVTLIRILAERDVATLETLWIETCSRMKRLQEFRSLNMVFAHVQDLLEREIIRQVGDEQYALK
jgi:hypothetical protein